MKLLCCNKIILGLLLSISMAFASVQDKSAILYYGEHISYPMVGIHDYIIVQPNHINTASHGFSVYKNKMYAYVSVGEMDVNTPEYPTINKSWILGNNKAWKSKVMDIRNPAYQDFLFQKMIEPKIKQGFQNFFFDTLDSYELVTKTDRQRQENRDALISFIDKFHKKYPKSKLIINRGFDIIDKIHQDLEAVLFESYYNGITGEKCEYKQVSDADRAWLNLQIKKIKSYKLNIIDVDYLPFNQMQKADRLVEKIKQQGLIPYVSNKDLNIYGRSSKNAIKREILTLIDETTMDRSKSSAHQNGALPLEYMGYIEKLHEINKEGLPRLEDMSQYAGVIIWLSENYTKPEELVKWIGNLQRIGLKVVFAGSFGMELSQDILTPLGIERSEALNNSFQNNKILFQDKMMGFEVAPTKDIQLYLTPKDARPLFTIKDKNNNISTLAAITPWGGYAVNDAFITEINGENIWVIDPYEFFRQALNLKPLVIPDPTTENGNRILFSHVDGDGFVNRVEWNPQLFSAQIIYDDILKVYKIPHSISIVGAEVLQDGMYPEIAPELIAIAKKIYALKNVEGASHTFTHPFFWGNIKNGNLDEQYRLKVNGYKFSIDRELLGNLNDINTKLMPINKPQAQLAKTIFWSGDCLPTEDILDYVYTHHILNINGGDTYITNSSPWQSLIAPMGLERGDYYQVYTGAQDENIYTNDWTGPFWGFKKVIQTFDLTNSPRRFKPIDIYYHYYSGSKRASINALKDVFDWAIKQDTTPIYTSEYIPKVMDYYTVSLANDSDTWLVFGMKNLHTLRIEKPQESMDAKGSNGILGFKNFENHTYYHLDNADTHLLKISTKKANNFYLIDANAEVTQDYISDKHTSISFKGYVDLKLHFNVPKQCILTSAPKENSRKFRANNELYLNYTNLKEVTINAVCQ